MFEFQLVDHGTAYPMGCVFCQATKGPLCDTFVERWGEQLYVCKQCATRIARVFGLAKGDKMTELLGAAELLEQKDAEISRREQQQSELRQVNANLRQELKESKAQVAAVQARLESARHLAATVERNASELIENVVLPVEVAA